MRKSIRQLSNAARATYEFAYDMYEDRLEKQRSEEAELRSRRAKQKEEWEKERQERHDEYMAPFFERHQDLSERGVELSSILERSMGRIAVVTNFYHSKNGRGPDLYQLTREEVGIECAKTLSTLGSESDAIIVEAFMSEKNSGRADAFLASADSIAIGFRHSDDQARVETSEYYSRLELSPYEIADRVLTHEQRLGLQNVGYIAVCSIGDLPGIGAMHRMPAPRSESYPSFDMEDIQEYRYGQLAAGGILVPPTQDGLMKPWVHLAESPDRTR